tara:strand:- start:118 stop:801 length:684 start_codon:yes stop_codon:yes gene_type:complete
MSASVLFYAPDVDGYQETLTYARAFFTSDSGQVDIMQKENPYDQVALNGYPKFRVSAQYTFFQQKDVVIFESLMKEAKETFIYMPLWFSLMQLDGAYTSGSSSSIPVEAPEGNPWNALSTTNYLHYTAWADGYFNSAAPSTAARDIYTTFIRFDNSDKYTYNHITFPWVSAVDLTNEEIDFTGAPAFNGNDKDLVAPVIRVNVVGSDFSYNLSGPEVMTATVQMVEL